LVVGARILPDDTTKGSVVINPLAAVRRVPPRAWARYRFVAIVLAPVMALFVFLRVVPTAQAFLMSFFEWSLLKPASEFVGLQNYLKLLSDRTSSARSPTPRSSRWPPPCCRWASRSSSQHARPRHQRSRRCAHRVPVLHPVLVPMVPVTLAWREIFSYDNGILNAFLGAFGIPKQPWLSDPNMALIAVIILSTWKLVGYNMIILLVGMRAVPREYHEAAAVDGAGAWHQFRHITVPLLAPVTLFVIVITTIASYNVFTQVYVLASEVQGQPGRLVRVVVYDIVENGFRFFKMGYASAEAVYLFLVISR